MVEEYTSLMNRSSHTTFIFCRIIDANTGTDFHLHMYEIVEQNAC
jgi:hypothetical protein